MIELKPNDYDYDDLAYVMFQSTLDLDGIILVFSCASSVNGSVSDYASCPSLSLGTCVTYGQQSINSSTIKNEIKKCDKTAIPPPP